MSSTGIEEGERENARCSFNRHGAFAVGECREHPATGGDGSVACSADMLLEALVACTGVTMRAAATAIAVKLRGGRVIAEGELERLASDKAVVRGLLASWDFATDTQSTRIAGLSPDFTQGTVEISSNPSDLAIQGDGFFMVQNTEGERLYTRNGQFKTNANNELVSLAGDRVLGYGVDANYEILRTTLVGLTIPLGSAATAQPTRNVFLQGTLTPSGDVADTAGVTESVVLGDASIPRPDTSAATIGAAPTADASAIAPSH